MNGLLPSGLELFKILLTIHLFLIFVWVISSIYSKDFSFQKEEFDYDSFGKNTSQVCFFFLLYVDLFLLLLFAVSKIIN